MAEAHQNARRARGCMTPDKFEEERPGIEPVWPARIEVAIKLAHALELVVKLPVDPDGPLLLVDFIIRENVGLYPTAASFFRLEHLVLNHHQRAARFIEVDQIDAEQLLQRSLVGRKDIES